MPTRRVIKSVLDGFLGTYVSRYSDFGGYCILGQVLDDLDGLGVDLLASAEGDARDARSFAMRLALARFAQQLAKAKTPASRVRPARLDVKLYARGASEWCGEETREGSVFVFAASAEMDDGKQYSATRRAFVAKHDPGVERRRLPLQRGGLGGEESTLGSTTINDAAAPPGSSSRIEAGQ